MHVIIFGSGEHIGHYGKNKTYFLPKFVYRWKYFRRQKKLDMR